jgi:hypothetical protein
MTVWPFTSALVVRSLLHWQEIIITIYVTNCHSMRAKFKDWLYIELRGIKSSVEFISMSTLGLYCFHSIHCSGD